MNAELPLALALTAGAVAAFNPCGFAPLPAHLTMLLTDDGTSRRGPMTRALVLSTAMTGGFVTVFGLLGLVVTPLPVLVGRHLPWATIVIGVFLIGFGIRSQAGRELPACVPGLPTGRPTAAPASLYGYGLSYAVASLSCTAGPFLAVVSASLTGGGLATFVTYALGMGLVVALLSWTVALAHAAAVARMRRLLPYMSRISGVLLVLAGLYVAYYGWYELRVFAGGTAGDPVAGTATAVRGALSGRLEALGAGWIVVALAVPVLGAFALRGLRRSARPAAETGERRPAALAPPGARGQGGRETTRPPAA
ncbi:cytochrome c biogenesis CcdA family protein [Streptosporangium canum]|uniref:cytochrome c biogenesis CcdA family protein n=1 Tax=Streptosporangium canum TaxID=324952 RepID=UPI00342ECDCD